MSQTECNELRNIEYKTMLLNNNHSEKDKGVLNIQMDNNNINIKQIDNFLQNEKKSTLFQKPWTKLEKMYKIQKLNEYADKFGQNENMSEEQIDNLKKFLLLCLNRKRLQRSKEVIYNKETEEIIEINGLSLNNENNFTLKNIEKKTSTLKNLPKSKKLKVKNKMKSENKN